MSVTLVLILFHQIGKRRAAREAGGGPGDG
jgi:hypothetical protein